MTLSTGPWWCAPVFASGSMKTVPAPNFSAPARAVSIAAIRVMPGVCGVFGSSSPAWTTRTPCERQSGGLNASRLVPDADRRQCARHARARDLLGLDREQLGDARGGLADADPDARQVRRAEDLGPQDVRDVVRVLDLEEPLARADRKDLRHVRDAARDALPEPQPDRFAQTVAQVAGGAPHERQRAVQEGRVAQAETHICGAPGDQLGDRVEGLAARVAQHAVELVQVVGDRQDVELLLGGEVAVDEPPRDARGPGD